jgi:hypothetical protein
MAVPSEPKRPSAGDGSPCPGAFSNKPQFLPVQAGGFVTNMSFSKIENIIFALHSGVFAIRAGHSVTDTCGNGLFFHVFKKNYHMALLLHH